MYRHPLKTTFGATFLDPRTASCTSQRSGRSAWILLSLILTACQLSPAVPALAQKTDDDLRERHDWLSVERQLGGQWRLYQHWRLENTPLQNNEISWTNLGPSNVSGRVISHAFHPDPDQIGTMLVGSASGGLWRTTDHGQSWSPLTDRLMSLAVSAVAYNPKDPNAIIVGTGEGYGNSDAVHGAGVFRSWDGGETWHDVMRLGWEEKLDGYDIVWDARDTSRVYFASSKGVYVSSSGGTERSGWEITLHGRTTSLIALPDESGTLLAAIGLGDGVPPSKHRPAGLYRSLDNGKTWSQVPSFLKTALAENDTPLAVGFTSLSAYDENVVYASVSHTLASGNGSLGILRSDDGGLQWSRVPTQVGDQKADLLCGDPFWDPSPQQCQGRYDNVIRVSPHDPNLVFVGGVDLYRTRDGGGSWNIVSKNAPHLPSSTNAIHPDHHDFAFHPSNPNLVYTFTDGGVYASENSGDIGSWRPINNGLVTMQITHISSSAHDPNWVAAGAQDNGTHLRFRENNDWRKLSTFDGDGYVVVVDYTDKDIIYGERQRGYLQRTMSGGKEGNCITQRCNSHGANEHNLKNTGIVGPGVWVTPIVMDPKDPKKLYTSTLLNVFVTENGRAPRGVTWRPVLELEKVRFIAVDQVDPKLVYAYSGSAKKLKRSRDGGATWTEATFPGESVTDMVTDPQTSGVLYVTRNFAQKLEHKTTGRVLMSTDAGDTWSPLDPNSMPADVHAYTIAVRAKGSNREIFVGTELGVFATADKGQTWIDVRGNFPYVVVRDLEYSATDNTIRAGTYGRGLWKANADQVFGQ